MELKASVRLNVCRILINLYIANSSHMNTLQRNGNLKPIDANSVTIAAAMIFSFLEVSMNIFMESLL